MTSSGEALLGTLFRRSCEEPFLLSIDPSDMMICPSCKKAVSYFM